MDSKAAEKLPGLKLVVQTIRSGSVPSQQGISLIRFCLGSNDPVLTSIAAWCIREMGKEGDILESVLENLSPKADSMTAAFVTLAKTSRTLRDASAVQKMRSYSELTMNNNPYLQVEAAKMLAKFDRNAGKIQLDRLAKEKKSNACVSANNSLRALQIADGETAVPPLPPSDELYETVLAVVEDTGAQHK